MTPFAIFLDDVLIFKTLEFGLITTPFLTALFKYISTAVGLIPFLNLFDFFTAEYEGHQCQPSALNAFANKFPE